MTRTTNLDKAVAAVANQAEVTQLIPENVRLTPNDRESIDHMIPMLTDAAHVLEETPDGEAA